MSESAKIVEINDKQLWLVDGDGWCLPVYATPYSSDGETHTHWVVRGAKPYLADPHNAITERFQGFNLSKSHTHWVVERGVLETVARKADGVTPDYYLVWDEKANSGKHDPEKEDVIDSEDEDSFIKFVCRRSAVDIRIARYFWREVKAGMLEWLIQKQRPIDFELFRLHPVPYRSNWKEIMLAKHPRCHLAFKKKGVRAEEMLMRSGFIEDLGSSDLASMKQSPKIFRWSLELEPKRLWVRSMEEAESYRLSAKRPVGYAKYYEQSLRRRFKDILAVFDAYLEEIRHPVGRVSESAAFGDPILLPRNKDMVVLPGRHTPGNCYFQLPSEAPRLKEGQERPAPMEKKIKEMLEVRDIQQVTEDVRNSVERTEMGGGAGGVPLLPPIQGDGTGV